MTVSGKSLSNQKKNRGLGQTLRRDAWWIEPVLCVAALIVFVIYATWAAIFGAETSHWGPYGSPFYSPHWVPGWWPAGLSPAFFMIWIPIGFRATCYFYRRVYYRSFFGDPPSCSVDEPKIHGTNYKGETAFPFIFNNLHRYFLYLAIVAMVFQWKEMLGAFSYQGVPGFGIGSLILLLDVIFLSLYVLSCHSFRHIVGGRKDSFSGGCAGGGCGGQSLGYKAWSLQSLLNERHGVYAWVSMGLVGLADLYVRALASGWITEWNTWGLSGHPLH
jgi:hypothetical protein